MKNIFKSIALIAVASLMLACNKEAPSKAEVESGFKAKKAVPTVVLDMTNYTVDNVAGTAVVTLTISGITGKEDSLSVGFLSSTDSTFSSAKYVAVENPVDGDITGTVSVLAGKTNWVMATVATTDGACYSDVLKLVVPDIEWYKKLPKTFYAHLADYWDDEFDSTIEVTYDPATHQVKFNNFDPYLAGNGISVYTIGLADITDVEHPTVNFTIDSDGCFPLTDDAGNVAYYSLVAVPFTDDYDDTDSYKITFNKDMTEMTVQAWGLYRTSTNGWWEIYPTTVYQAL